MNKKDEVYIEVVTKSGHRYLGNISNKECKHLTDYALRSANDYHMPRFIDLTNPDRCVGFSEVSIALESIESFKQI